MYCFFLSSVRFVLRIVVCEHEGSGGEGRAERVIAVTSREKRLHACSHALLSYYITDSANDACTRVCRTVPIFFADGEKEVCSRRFCDEQVGGRGGVEVMRRQSAHIP